MKTQMSFIDNSFGQVFITLIFFFNLYMLCKDYISKKLNLI